MTIKLCAHARVNCPQCSRPRRRSRAEDRRRTRAIALHVEQLGYWCPGWNREPHESRDLTADHVVPQSQGGQEGELQVLCRPCNSRKGSLTGRVT